MWITQNKAQLGVCFKVTPIQPAVAGDKQTTVSTLLHRKDKPSLFIVPPSEPLKKYVSTVVFMLCPSTCLAFYRNLSWIHRDKSTDAIDRDVQTAEPQSHCLHCENYLLPTARQPTHIKPSGCTHCPAQSQLQGSKWKSGDLYSVATVFHCATSRHRDTSLNQNFTVGDKGLNTEVLKASGEDTDSEHFVLHL